MSHLLLREEIFEGKKISRISRILAKFARTNSFFDPRKCRFATINSRKIFQELRISEYWSLLQTTSYFVIYLSKKVLIFTEIVLKTINYEVRGKNIP